MADIHIGKEIEKRYQQSGLKLGEFAMRLNTGKRNVYSIFDRKEISTSQLQKISEVLDFDFFQFYNLATRSSREIHPAKPTKVTLLVELDGTQPTVDKWIARINAINTAVK